MTRLPPVEDEAVDVLNVRVEKKSPCGIRSSSLRDQVVDGLSSPGFEQSISTNGGDIKWSKNLPSTILYEGKGIELYENITQCSHYYLYREELAIIRNNATSIAAALLNYGSAEPLNDGLPEVREIAVRTCKSSHIRNGINRPQPKKIFHLTLLDLGAGRLDKAECLIRSLIKVIRKRNESSRDIYHLSTYCAVDLQYTQLHQRLRKLLRDNPDLLNGRFKACDSTTPIAARAICGSYDDCVELLRRDAMTIDTPAFEPCEREVEQRKCLLWLGSSFTNLKPSRAADFLRKFSADDILRPGDLMLIGLDRCRNGEKVESAYRESCQCWQDYIRNGVKNAGLSLGGQAEDALDGSGNWSYVGRWDKEEGRHMRFGRSSRDLRFATDKADASPIRIDIKAGENIFFCQSYKYTSNEAELCFRSAGFVIQQTWINDQDDCSLYLLQKE